MRNPFRRRPATAPEPTEGILCLPPTDIVELAEGSASNEWEIGRPGTFTAFRGGRVTLTEEDLRQVAEAYDPNYLAAAINRDHEAFGPSLGWIESVRFDGQRLLARVRDLASDLVDDIRTKRYQRASPELVPHDHPDGRQSYYLRGVAALGNRDPAIRGMRPLAAASGQGAVLIHLSADDPPADTPEDPPAPAPPAEADPEATPGEEPVPPPAAEPEPTTDEGDPMSGPSSTGNTPGANTTGANTPTDPPAATPPAQPPADPGSVQLAAERSALDRELAATRALRAEARLERAENRVERDLTALGGRITPALRRRIAPLMVALAAAEEPPTIQLAGADGQTTEVTHYDALRSALDALPDTLTALAADMANEDPEEPMRDPRDAATRKVHLAAGVTDERLAELTAKYGREAIFGSSN